MESVVILVSIRQCSLIIDDRRKTGHHWRKLKSTLNYKIVFGFRLVPKPYDNCSTNCTLKFSLNNGVFCTFKFDDCKTLGVYSTVFSSFLFTNNNNKKESTFFYPTSSR